MRLLSEEALLVKSRHSLLMELLTCLLSLRSEINVFWVARLNTGQRDREDKSMENEITIMNLVRCRTSIPVPNVYAWRSTSHNVFKTPFVLMQAVNGQKLSVMTRVYEKYKGKILDQMASILIELSTIQSLTIGDFQTLNSDTSPFDKKGFKSSTEYYGRHIDKHLQALASVRPEDERDQHVGENRRCRRLSPISSTIREAKRSVRTDRPTIRTILQNPH